MDTVKYEETAFVEKLAQLDIDINIGLKYCGDIDFYMEVLGISLEAYKERLGKLICYYEAKDYTNYTILVHSIKSGAANIGAIKLSDMARTLENAGKNDNYEYIVYNHNSFVEYYCQVMDGLGKIILNNTNECEKENELSFEYGLSEEEWDIYLSQLEYNLNELEIEAALELLEIISMHKLLPEILEIVASMRNLLQHFNVEDAKAYLVTLKKLKNLTLKKYNVTLSKIVVKVYKKII